MKIIDCFTFFNELGLLEYRLNLLNDVVDIFILVEATRTFTNKPKSLFYKDNIDYFKKFKSKIVHIVVDDMPGSTDAWECEFFQRNAIERGISQCNLNETDCIIISDVDEIPNPNILQKIRVDGCPYYSYLQQDFYYYNTNTISERKWQLSKIMSVKDYINILNKIPQNARKAGAQKNIENCGWHFSCFGGSQQISTKLKSFAHQEYNTPEYTNIKNIEERIQNGKDLFDRANEPWRKTNDYTSIPKHEYLLECIDRWHKV